VYFSLFGEENSQNPHAYICGPSASGKTFFLNSLARNAHVQGVQVVSVGLYGSALEIDDSDIINIEAKDFGLPDTLVMSRFARIASHRGKWTGSEKECLEMMMDEDEMKGTAEDLILEIRGCSNDTFKDALTQKLNALVMQGAFNSEPDWDDILYGTPVTIVAADGDTDTLEAIFRSLFNWKQHGDRSPMLLIIDECQTCDLSQSGTISKLIMRQGRKFGLMCFLASQYLSAEDARNISHTLSQCDTTFAFEPGNNANVIKRLGISTDDKQNRSNIQNVPKYHCVAKGKLSCNGAEVNYPVVLHA
jgi:GTPase SAR1 family protein